MEDRSKIDPEGSDVREEKGRGVPRTTTTGDPGTDLRQPGAGAVEDEDPGLGHDEDVTGAGEASRRR
jgi:hypothetical protein